VFAGIRGAAEVVLLPQVDGQPDLTRMIAAAKPDQAAAPFTMDLARLPEDVAEVAILVLLHAGAPGDGLTDGVRWVVGR
jgi:hypothetical protein